MWECPTGDTLRSCQSEISQFQFSRFVYEKILRFEITMKNLLLMTKWETTKKLEEEKLDLKRKTISISSQTLTRAISARYVAWFFNIRKETHIECLQSLRVILEIPTEIVFLQWIVFFKYRLDNNNKYFNSFSLMNKTNGLTDHVLKYESERLFLMKDVMKGNDIRVFQCTEERCWERSKITFYEWRGDEPSLMAVNGRPSWNWSLISFNATIAPSHLNLHKLSSWLHFSRIILIKNITHFLSHLYTTA